MKVYPHNAQAERLAELVGTKTLTIATLRQAKAMGFALEYVDRFGLVDEARKCASAARFPCRLVEGDSRNMTELDKIVTLCAMVRALRQTADLSDVRKRLRAYERAELNLGEIVLLDLDERAMWIASIERTLMRRPVGTTARSPLL